MSTEWKTKQGTRRVRVEPPTLEEAIFAAEGLASDHQEQADIAAALMGIPADKALAAIQKSARTAARTGRVVSIPASGSQRAIVVERRPSRGTFRARV